jgi:membrane protease YdiL (CAAX protease family)
VLSFQKVCIKKAVLLLFSLVAVFVYATQESQTFPYAAQSLRHFYAHYPDTLVILVMAAVFPGGLKSIGWRRERWGYNLALGLGIWSMLEVLGATLHWASRVFLPNLTQPMTWYGPPFEQFGMFDWGAIAVSASITASGSVFHDSVTVFLFVRLREALPGRFAIMTFFIVPLLFVLMHLWWLESTSGALTIPILFQFAGAALLQLLWLVIFLRTRSILPVYVSHFLLNFAHGAFLW